MRRRQTCFPPCSTPAQAAGAAARQAVLPGTPDGAALAGLAAAVAMSYRVQLGEGMDELPQRGELAKKYCGGGWGGYALYLFEEQAARDAVVAAGGGDAVAIEPFLAEGGTD